MAATATDRYLSDLDRAVGRLRQLTMDVPADDPTRPQLEAATDRLSSYALAVRTAADAGVSVERLASLTERGWREAAQAYTAARRVTVNGPLGPEQPPGA